MRDQHDDIVATTSVATAVDSHGPAPKPSRVPALSGESRNGAQKGLDGCAAVPLHQRLVVSYPEAAALGIAPERSLRRLVAIGRVKRSVIRAGRSVRFVVADLLDEMREVGG
jgi:hypothetical protein